MDKKLSAALTLTPEWTKADVALKDDSQSIAIELRQFRMPDGEPITRAYKQLNGEILPKLPSASRTSLLELARVLGQNTNNTWTFALTRVEQSVNDTAGLSLDCNRIQVLGLASKRGVQSWFQKVCDSYGSDPQISRLCGFTGLSWGKPPQPFLLVTVPLEGRLELQQMAEQAKFKLSESVPRDPVINKQTHRSRFVEYPTPLFDLDNLLYLAYSAQEVAHAKPISPDEVREV